MRGSYGVDAPGVLLGLLAGTVLVFGAAAFVFGLGSVLGGVLLCLGGLEIGSSAASFAYTTLRGKRTIWGEEIDRLGLLGTERVLDIGCGRGLVLIGAARRLRGGAAVGLDLWRTRDQSGNSFRATLQNAKAEGVANRVTLLTGDMRRLPFADKTFDLVVSSLAVHNVPDGKERADAIREAFRVIRPGGQLRVADFVHAEAYAAVLRKAGAKEVDVRRLGWRFWYGGPWLATRMISATK